MSSLPHEQPQAQQHSSEEHNELIQHQYEQTQAQLNAISLEIQSSQPLISKLHPISSLVDLYDDEDNNSNSGFKRGAKYLATKYKNWRQVRGDGNCCYRAFLYALCESLLPTSSDGSATTAGEELKRLTSFAKYSFDSVTQYGYDPSALEMFHEAFVELFQSLSTAECLYNELNVENSISEYCSWYLRILTAVHLKKNSTRFQPFLESYHDINEFCVQEVEPLGKECGMVQVLALAEALSVLVRIEYLDGREISGDKDVMMHEFGVYEETKEARSTSITLLYRPGHYDILY